MKLIQLQVENYKRVRAVRLRLEGKALVQITGRNAQGKSSVIDAVWAALGGKGAAAARPVRDGADRAEVALDLGELIVRRTFTANGKTTLVVTGRDGSALPSPQAVLDKMVGAISFDPLAFVRDEKGQAATLRRLAGIDERSIEEERKRLYDERTAVNRQVKQLQVQAGDGFPIDAPDEEVSVSDLAREHARLSGIKTENDAKRRQLEDLAKAVMAARQHQERARAALRAAQEEANKALQAVEDARVRWQTAADEAEELKDPDMGEIADKIASADELNRKVRARRERARILEELRAAGVTADKLTAQMEALDEAKAKMLASAKLPVAGLGIVGDVVTLNGVPLAQASSAEQLRVSLAIFAALNPELRLVLVRDGSLLDADALAAVSKWAEEQDVQILMERVADGEPVGIVIEDGEVAAVHA